MMHSLVLSIVRTCRLTWPALLLGSALLTGCAGGTTPMHQYTLPAGPLVSRAAPASAPAIMVMPVQLSGFLQGRGIMYQTSALELNEARNHLWADDLGPQLDRTLAQALAARLPHARLLPGDSADSPVLYATVVLDRFQGRFDGKAVVSGQYRLMNAERLVVMTQPFAYDVPLRTDGYPALIEAMNQGWLQMADQLARSIAQYAH